MDTDKSGRIERTEFMSFYADQLTHSDSREDICEAFTILADGSTSISDIQLKRHFKDADLLNYLISAMPPQHSDGGMDFAQFTKAMFETTSQHAKMPVSTEEEGIKT